MKHKSYETMKKNLQMFFKNSPTADVITIEEAFQSWGRPNPTDLKKNKQWLSNEMPHFKYHDLLLPVYSSANGYRKLVKLELTLKGKLALGRIGEAPATENSQPVKTNGNGHKITLGEIVEAMPRIRKENQDFEISLDVKLKKAPARNG